MNQPAKPINRSNVFILAYQIEGLCSALRMTVPNGLKPGAGTIAILNKLIADLAGMSAGSFMTDLPKISAASDPVDVLAMAETIRTSVMAFMSPEEISEHQKAIGFHPTK